MSNSYAAVSALIFAVVAIMHVVRLVNRWSVGIGPYQRLHECIVGWPCRCGPARNLGLHAIAALALGRRNLARRSRRGVHRLTRAAESSVQP
jgi:hypothetical protein